MSTAEFRIAPSDLSQEQLKSLFQVVDGGACGPSSAKTVSASRKTKLDEMTKQFVDAGLDDVVADLTRSD
jgi:hypothetical protein